MKSMCSRMCDKLQASKMNVDEYGKAKSFQMFSLARPHMRGFHTSWFCFFTAFTAWFGIQPLIPSIQREFNLTKKEIAYSGIASISATIFVRAATGALCDRFGPRRMMSALLCIGSVPLALSGLVRNGAGLIAVRFFIGILGGTFVPCQFWTSSMFNTKIIGTANAFVGGWGNLGGGFTFILMPAIFTLVQSVVHDEFLAWKIAVIIPAVLVFGLGILILWTSDDCPQGHWSNRKLLPTTCELNDSIECNGVSKKLLEVASSEKKPSGDVEIVYTDTPLEEISARFVNLKATQLLIGSTVDLSCSQSEEKQQSESRIDIWVCIAVGSLMLHYGLCFGIEIAVNTVMNLYLLYNFKQEGCTEVIPFNDTNSTVLNAGLPQNDATFGCSILTPNSASLITSLFGLMNLFARAMGGAFSDLLRKHFSTDLKGRLMAHSACLLLEGILLIVFSQMRQLTYAVVAMVFFSLAVMMSEGTTFAIVPYVNPRKIGLISGLVGAGGTSGGMIWNTLWSQMVEYDPSKWFLTLGICVLVGNVLSIFILKLDRSTKK